MTHDAMWNGNYKIPWDDPEFSRRMLAEHLSQQHDMASRRMDWIDKQVAWLHDDLLAGQAARILDLGCGPGFYSHRLGERGHCCHGIDFGPASIAYAREHDSTESQTDFVLGDIRQVDYGGPYDLAMLLYGELNVFSPEEALTILKKAQKSLDPGGQLIIEAQAPEAVKRIGCSEASEQAHESGLFSDEPHHCRIENEWLPEEQVARQTFHVNEADGEGSETYFSTTKAWSDDALMLLLTETGFQSAMLCDTWPCNSDDLKLWVAVRE